MKYLFLILIIFCLGNVGYSQDYKPLVKEGNQWSVLHGGLGAMLKVCCVKTEHLKLLGDTTIESKVYKKVFSSLDALKQDWRLMAFIREDVSAKKVWLRDLNNTEGLIYDFDVQVGSEVTLYNFLYPMAVSYLVTNIDSVLFQTEYRKRYTLKADWGKEQWIEGVGSEDGVLSVNLSETGGSFRRLLCFSDNNIQYVNPQFQTCHKTSFTPSITNTKTEQAIVNQSYHFQITTTAVFDIDTISYYLSGSLLSDGLKLDTHTGLISGIPTKVGTYHLFICVMNNGYTTDCLATDLVVLPETVNPEHSYEPFIREGKQWRSVQTLIATGESGNETYLVDLVYFRGDTIVDNIKYSKLYIKSEQPTPKRAYLACLMREDTVNQQVYVVDLPFKTTALLYDFKLNKGDEINRYIFGGIYSKHTVIKVDTINTSNRKLKRIEFDDSNIWIEGIGQVTGSTMTGGGELICMRDNNDIWYLNSKYSNCDTIFTQGPWDNIQTLKRDEVAMFPNPIVSTSQIKVHSESHEPFKIEIYSYSGAMIKEDYFSDNYPIGSIGLEKGLYVYRIVYNNQVIKMDKIIVANQ